MFFFLDNELDRADHAEIQHHLDECGPCLARYDLERTVKTLVARSCTEKAPEGLRQRVQLSIRRCRSRSPAAMRARFAAPLSPDSCCRGVPEKMYVASWTTPGAKSVGGPMGKTGRKRRARKKKAANHGKRPNA